MNQQANKSPIGWVMSFAGRKKSLYTISVVLAVIGVLCGILPFIITGNMIRNLIEGNREWSFYLVQGGLMAVCWIGKLLCHNISTTCSHVATFHVLGEIRKQLCDKLSRVPLGYVKDTPSGSLKNIMVERLDSIETTLAHILPEFTSNLLAPACVLWGLDIHTAEEISALCHISRQAAEFRAERMELLYERGKFLTSPLEQQVYDQFAPFIQEFRYRSPEE